MAQQQDFDKSLLKYTAVYPQAPMDMKYHYYDGDVLKIRPETSRLIKSVEELREYAESCKGLKVAVDTETTGLSYHKDFIVGFSIAKDMYHGIYVPIRHQIKRVEEVEEIVLYKDGNPVTTKSGKTKTKKKKIETFFENPANLPAKECLDILFDIMKNANLVLMHNSEFDLTMIGQEGYDVMSCKTFDTTILTYIYDSENKSWNKLKEASKIVLGRHPMKFAEALGTEDNFRYVDLDVAYPYASDDALNTYGLFTKLYPAVKQLLSKAPKIMTFKGEKHPYNVVARDNELIRAFTDYYNKVDLLVNRQTAKDYQKYVEDTLVETETEIYKFFNKGVFNLSTGSKEFKDTMKEFHIVTGAFTEKGAPSYGKEGVAEMGRTLDNIKDVLTRFRTFDYNEKSGAINKRHSKDELKMVGWMLTYGKEQFKMVETVNTLNVRTIEGIKCTKRELFDELKLMYKTIQKNMNILQLIQKRSSLMKALNSYIAKLTEVDKCHMRYRLQGTASGRLSSGNGSKSDKRKNHYFIDLNAQNLTKPHSAYYKAVKSDEEGNILGWKFELVSEEYYHEHKEDEIIVEGSDPKNNIRNCLVAPEGRYILSMDYSAQEYLVLAILSGDMHMVNNFKNGVDPHTATAYMVWGEENYDRQKRKKAKACIGEGTLLLTNNGYKTADELDVEKDLLVDFNGEPQHWAMTTENRELVKVTYNNGITETYTPDHKVRVWNGHEVTWKQVQELTEKDDVAQYVGLYNAGNDNPVIKDYSHVNTGKPCAKTSFNINCKEFAYLAGIYLGDGNMQKKDRLDQKDKPIGIRYCVEEEMLDTVMEYLETLGLHHSTPKPIGKNKKVYQIDTYNVAWAALTEELLGSTKHKHLDRQFRSLWTKETWAYYLAGLLDTDGFTRAGRTEFASTLQGIIDSAILACSVVGAKYQLRNAKTKYQGEDYPYLLLVMYDMPKIPQLVSRKMVRGKVSRQGGWTIPTEDAIALRSKYVEWGDNYRSHFYTTMGNVIKNKANLIGATLGVIREKIPDYPIQPNMACVHVVKKEKIQSGKTFIIQTSNHLYATLGAGNANCNFLMNYMGGPTTLAKNLNIPLEEAEHIINMYQKGFWQCIQWKEKCIRDCIDRQGGVAYTLFGRPRQFSSRLRTSADISALGQQGSYKGISSASLMSKANGLMKAVERRIVSHEIQSTCGDICRWDLIRLYRKYFKHRDPDIDFMTTVHDEINYTVTKEKVIQYAREIDDIMTITDFREDLPIKTSIDLGYTLGVLFPFEWEDETRTNLVPSRA